MWGREGPGKHETRGVVLTTYLFLRWRPDHRLNALYGVTFAQNRSMAMQRRKSKVIKRTADATRVGVPCARVAPTRT